MNNYSMHRSSRQRILYTESKSRQTYKSRKALMLLYWGFVSARFCKLTCQPVYMEYKRFLKDLVINTKKLTHHNIFCKKRTYFAIFLSNIIRLQIHQSFNTGCAYPIQPSQVILDSKWLVLTKDGLHTSIPKNPAHRLSPRIELSPIDFLNKKS